MKRKQWKVKTTKGAGEFRFFADSLAEAREHIKTLEDDETFKCFFGCVKSKPRFVSKKEAGE